MVTMNRASFQRQFVPGINMIVGLSYKTVEDESKNLFETSKSDRAFEEEIVQGGFGTAPNKSEGAAVQYDSASQSYVSRYTMDTIALGFAITEEAMEDNLYSTVGELKGKELGRAMANTFQGRAADMFNNGFNTSYPGGDGLPLFSASHATTGDGNQSNVMSTDLSEAQLEQAIINITLMENDRGSLINAQPRMLLVPPQNMFTAERLLKSTLQPGTANNAINAINSIGFFPQGWQVNRRLTDPDSWFIKTDITNGTKVFIRTPLSYKMEGDFDTGNMRYKVRQRYKHGWTDWRGWYGSQGA